MDCGAAGSHGVWLSCILGGRFPFNNLSITLFIGSPPEGWLKIAADVMAHMDMGAAFTYSAVRVAPSAPKYVALVTTVLLLVFAGLSF
jgi:hypothetical protein